MKTLKVQAANGSYDICAGRGLLAEAGQRLAAMGFEKAHIVTDDVVAPLYLEKVRKSLTDAGVAASETVLQNGESAKCQANLFAIYGDLLEAGIARPDCVVALGGGVVGDIAGYAAASFMRGVGFVQMPTTLLAQVDSSVGGKVAINLPQAKNIVGAFYQPGLVLADMDALETLPPRQLAAGMAEVVKYAAIADADMERIIGEGDMQEIVLRSCAIKAQYVAEDPFDLGRRMELNFGHTIGHGVESASGLSLLHGEAVAMGMAMMARLGEAEGHTEPGVAERIEGLIRRTGLATAPPEGLDAGAVRAALLRDKKSAKAGRMSAIFLQRMGRAQITPVDGEWLAEQAAAFCGKAAAGMEQ